MTTLWNGDDELFALSRRELFTAVVGDVMDKLGLMHQFLPARIQPIDRDMVAVGRAMTVLEADGVDEDKPFGKMLEALDELKKDEIYVCNGGSPRYACWGELMSTRAIKCGAAGAVMNGYHRDTRGIAAMGFPTFSLGAYAQDQGPRGRVVDYRVTLEMDGVRVRTGDIVFGDVDGVCVIPREAEREVFTAAIEKARGEKTVLEALQQGMSASAAFERFGIL